MSKFVTCLCTLLIAVTAIAKTQEVSFETSDGVQVYGDIYRSADGDNAPVILLFHQGGSDARGEYTQIAIRLMDNGYNVLAIDQRTGGDRFGGGNRTMEGLHGQEFGYCDAYPDLEAALNYVREAGFDGRLAIWGSSYSAALSFQLAVKNSDEVSALLGFSPSSGAALAECSLLPYLSQIDVPTLALRPQSEFEIESVQAQMKEFEAQGIQTYVANPGVHGSSMLNADRVGESTEAAWAVVLEFLAETLRTE